MRRFVLVLVLAACGGGGGGSGKGPSGPGGDTAARPTIDECKVALDHVIDVSLVAVFEDDEDLRADAMSRVHANPPGESERRCAAEAKPEQVACLGAVTDVPAVRTCAPPVDQCAHSDPRDEAACR